MLSTSSRIEYHSKYLRILLRNFLFRSFPGQSPVVDKLIGQGAGSNCATCFASHMIQLASSWHPTNSVKIFLADPLHLLVLLLYSLL